MSTSAKIDETALIEGIKRNDPQIIRDFVQEYQGKIFRLCLQYVHNEDEAYDMVQEVFVTLLRKIENFRGESKLSTWLYSVTVFTCIGYLRKKRKKNESSFDDLSPNNYDTDFLMGKWVNQTLKQNKNPLESDLMKKEAAEVLQKEIQNLPYDYKAIFILKELEGLSIKEIRKTIPISIFAIKTRLHRARLYLRDKLGVYSNEFEKNGK